MSRRAHGEGTFFYREDLGVWRWRGYYTDPLSGQMLRKELSAVNKKDLRIKVESWQQEVAAGRTKRLKVKDWCLQWLNDVIKKTVKPATYTNYRITVNNHIIPTFGELWLDKLTTHTIQQYLNSIAETHTPRTVQTIKTHINACLSAAIDHGYILRHPGKPCRVPRIPRIEKEMLTTAEVKLLLEKAKSGDYNGVNKDSEAGQYLIREYYLVILLAVTTGLRQGEILALRKKSLDLKNCKIRVDMTLSNVRGKGTMLDSPKTAHSERVIDIPRYMADELLYWLKLQNEFAEKYAGIFANNQNLLFTNSIGKPLSSVNFMHRVWHPLLKAAGINRKIVFHDLRHYHASLLLENNVNIKVISERLGHSNTSITLNIYSHLINKTLQAEAVKALDSLNLVKGAEKNDNIPPKTD